MKLVVAMVRPGRPGEVLESLHRAGVRGPTLSPARSHRGETEQMETYRQTSVKMDLQGRVRVGIGVPEPFVDRTVQAILASARTGEAGGGKMFALPVEKDYRIRTGEHP